MSERRNILTDPQSSRVKRVAGLFRRSSRNRHGRYLAEGPQAVREAIKYVPEQVLDLYLTEAAGQRHQDILQSAQQANIYLHWVSQAVMEAISTDAQGLVAVMDLAGIRAGADALAQVLKGATQVVVMSETQDPGNAGTIIRVADAAGADAVIMARGCVELNQPQGDPRQRRLALPPTGNHRPSPRRHHLRPTRRPAKHSGRRRRRPPFTICH